MTQITFCLPPTFRLYGICLSPSVMFQNIWGSSRQQAHTVCICILLPHDIHDNIPLRAWRMIVLQHVKDWNVHVASPLHSQLRSFHVTWCHWGLRELRIQTLVIQGKKRALHERCQFPLGPFPQPSRPLGTSIVTGELPQLRCVTLKEGNRTFIRQAIL